MNLTNKTILSLCGGGVKGFAHIGVIKYLEEHDIIKNITTFAGTSIGAILAACLVLGYNCEEINNFSTTLDLSKVIQFNELETLFKYFGCDKGTRINYIIKKLITNKNFKYDITLKELYDLTKKKLIITATNLNTCCGVYLDYLTYPNLQLNLALRMASCIPMIMTPILYNNELYIDGGCTIQLPLTIFNDERDKVLAINFPIINDDNNTCNATNGSDAHANYNTITSLEQYLFRIFNIIINNNNVNTQNFDIIDINVNVSLLDIDLTLLQKKEIIDNSYNQLSKKIALTYKN